MKKKKTCLVTGGAGFIGTNLIKRLVQDQQDVICFDNYSTGSKKNEQEGCTYFNIDLSNQKKYDNFLDSKPDIIFHLAALARIEPSFKFPCETFEDNVNSTLNILDYARKNNIKVVYAGSSSFHGGVYENPYTYTKWQGEELCKMFNKVYNLNTVICRFYNVYGPYQIMDGPYSAIVGIFQRQFLDKIPFTITGNGEQRRDFTHVHDIVEGLVRASEHLCSGATFELGTGVNYSINELAKMFGEDYPVKYIAKREGEMLTTLCDISDAKEKIEYNPKQDLADYVKAWVSKQE